MRKFLPLLILVTALSLVPSRYADEGMWTFDNPPFKYWKEKYGFEPSQDWLDHLRLATVRLTDGGAGGTGCFVSPDGLVFTVQHVGSGQVAKLSKAGSDFVKDGFYARTRAEELRCPEMEANVLVSYEEVTQRVRAAINPSLTAKAAAAQRRAAVAAIEKEESANSKLKAEVVMLYNGGEYWLYRFKRYTDVRVVFVPEEQIAYFGGDEDNFTYPRHSFDVTFLRVYENGQPARTDQYLRWADQQVREGDLVFLPGFPSSTARLSTVAQLSYQRDYGNPLQLQILKSRMSTLEGYAERGPEQSRQVAQLRRILSNTLKRLDGQQTGLENPRVFKRKEDEEAAFRQAVSRKSEWQRAYGNAWREIETAYKKMPVYGKRLAYSNLAPARLATLALLFVRYAEEIRKPNQERYEEFRDERLAAIRATLLSPAPIYPELEEAVLGAWLVEGLRALGKDDEFVKNALCGLAPTIVAERGIGGTQLHKLEFRRALLDGGVEAITSSDDAMLVLARNVEPVIRELRAWNEERVLNVEANAGERIANARFAVYGKHAYPDANFNLRLAYGTVAGYQEAATPVPFKTTFDSLFERAVAFGQQPPYGLPKRWLDGKARLELSTPLNFVYTADTLGGNSGSPVINRRGEVVGINFDGNLQKLPNRYLYVDEREGSRAVGVHTAALVEALQKLYGAGDLVREIKGDLLMP